MSTADTLALIEAEDRARTLHLAARQLRIYLAGALCASCGEPLGDGGDIEQDDDGRTMHAGCAAGEQPAT